MSDRAEARVLVVDDSLTIRRALEFILKPQGYELAFAADGREALARAAEFDPDLILLDYVLPDMRGPDVCEALIANPVTASTPVVLVSAKGASIRQTYQDAPNVVSYVTKPFKQQVVLSVVQNALARGRVHGSAAAVAGPAGDPGRPREPVRRDPGESGAARPISPSAATTASPGAPGSAGPMLDGGTRAGSTASNAIAHDAEAGLALLLDQVEEAFAGLGTVSAIASLWPTLRGPAGLPAPGDPALDLARRLRLAAARCAELDRHLDVAQPALGPMLSWRWLPDGSLGSVQEALVEAHAAICRAVVSLCVAGAGEAPTAAPPGILVVGSAGDAVGGPLAALLETLTEPRDVLEVRGDPGQIPHLVALLRPAVVLAPAAPDAALAAALRRARASTAAGSTRFLTFDPGAEQCADADGSPGDVVRSREDLEQLLVSLAAAVALEPEPADPLAGPPPRVLA